MRDRYKDRIRAEDIDIMDLAANIPNIKDSTAKFNPYVEYENTFKNMPNDPNYITTDNNVLGGNWGKIPAVTRYSIKASDSTTKPQALKLAHKDSCPTPKRGYINQEKWGDYQYAGNAYSKIELIWNGESVMIIWEMLDGRIYATDTKSKSPIVFIELVGGGGAGGGCYVPSLDLRCIPGGGGGGGAYCNCIFDLTKSGDIRIDLGAFQNNFGNTSLNNNDVRGGAKGNESTLTTETGLVLHCEGGEGGGRGKFVFLWTYETGDGGAGGKFKADNSKITNFDSGNLNQNSDQDHGLLFLNWYYGKAGGKGVKSLYGRDDNYQSIDGGKGEEFAEGDLIKCPILDGHDIILNKDMGNGIKFGSSFVGDYGGGGRGVTPLRIFGNGGMGVGVIIPKEGNGSAPSNDSELNVRSTNSAGVYGGCLVHCKYHDSQNGVIVTQIRRQSVDGGTEKRVEIYFNSLNDFIPTNVYINNEWHTVSTNTSTTYNGKYYIRLVNISNVTSTPYPDYPEVGTYIFQVN